MQYKIVRPRAIYILSTNGRRIDHVQVYEIVYKKKVVIRLNKCNHINDVLKKTLRFQCPPAYT